MTGNIKWHGNATGPCLADKYDKKYQIARKDANSQSASLQQPKDDIYLPACGTLNSSPCPCTPTPGLAKPLVVTSGDRTQNQLTVVEGGRATALRRGEGGQAWPIAVGLRYCNVYHAPCTHRSAKCTLVPTHDTKLSTFCALPETVKCGFDSIS